MSKGPSSSTIRTGDPYSQASIWSFIPILLSPYNLEDNDFRTNAWFSESSLHFFAFRKTWWNVSLLSRCGGPRVSNEPEGSILADHGYGGLGFELVPLLLAPLLRRFRWAMLLQFAFPSLSTLQDACPTFLKLLSFKNLAFLKQMCHQKSFMGSWEIKCTF